MVDYRWAKPEWKDLKDPPEITNESARDAKSFSEMRFSTGGSLKDRLGFIERYVFQCYLPAVNYILALLLPSLCLWAFALVRKLCSRETEESSCICWLTSWFVQNVI